MKLGEAAYRAITAGRSPYTEPETFDDAVAYFLTRFPSISAAARALDVPRSTFSAWARGRVPRDAERVGALVRAARRDVRRRRLSKGRERRLRGEDL